MNDVTTQSLTPDLVTAARGGSPTRRPVWFMRQAGRSLPEYREIRAGHGMLESCFNADLVREITLQPVRRHDVDAAILFSDIVVPLKAAGVDLDIRPGVGPVVENPVRSVEDVRALPLLDTQAVGAVLTAVRNIQADLHQAAGPNQRKALIGFAGAPFTLASYLVEGGPSRNHDRTKALMHGAPDVWHELAGRLADMAIVFLRGQIDAGVDAIQLFDSWAGTLSAADYERFVAPHSARVFAEVGDAVPRIHFGVGTGELLGLMGRVGADVVGVDWRIPLDVAAGRIGDRKALQGNLDPAVLAAPWPVVADHVRRIVDEADRAMAAPDGPVGHIFNLGHGVLPDTDPDVLTRVVELVHQL